MSLKRPNIEHPVSACRIGQPFDQKIFVQQPFENFIAALPCAPIQAGWQGIRVLRLVLFHARRHPRNAPDASVMAEKMLALTWNQKKSALRFLLSADA